MSGTPTRLYCLPHAGGTPAAYRGWAEALAPGIAVVPLQPPRRTGPDARPATVARAAGTLAGRLAPETNRPYAFFGHSLGALVAFETVRALLHRGCPAPRRLFVCGCGPPPVEAVAGRALHTLPDEDFLRAVGRRGELPPEVLADEELQEVLVPQLRADYALAETYQYRPGPPLPCPVTVLCGQSDPLVDHGRLPAWREHTTAAAPVRFVPGGHLLLHSAAAHLHGAVRAAL
ncbi:thioesterase II family protein [Streptoverticillium reticulum]|uniref:thioesterase II family protein n=1 Tax=Streptoverticillium reticulum TaxID=1433415 RepID=UPI0039BF5E52